MPADDQQPPVIAFVCVKLARSAERFPQRVGPGVGLRGDTRLGEPPETQCCDVQRAEVALGGGMVEAALGIAHGHRQVLEDGSKTWLDEMAAVTKVEGQSTATSGRLVWFTRSINEQ